LQKRGKPSKSIRYPLPHATFCQSDLYYDSGLAIAAARTEDPHREAGGRMTVDLYQPPLRYRDAYDESSADGVTPRPHWAYLMESLQAIGPDELGRRWARAERPIRENGITYNIYGDPLGASRTWKIDIVPLLIPADEWRFIEAGIIQRARLLNLLLADL